MLNVDANILADTRTTVGRWCWLVNRLTLLTAIERLGDDLAVLEQQHGRFAELEVLWQRHRRVRALVIAQIVGCLFDETETLQ